MKKKCMVIALSTIILFNVFGCERQQSVDGEISATEMNLLDELNTESVSQETENVPSDWKDYNLVGHSFGQIDEYTYTGSLEAFEKKYSEGIRVFEVDLATAADGVIVLRHDWDIGFQEGISSENIPTSEEFKSVPIYGEYTPLLLTDLFELMREYEDIYIVTDSKETRYNYVVEMFREIVHEAEDTDSIDLMDRFIVQIYSENMYNAVREAYLCENWIFTLYARWDGDLDDFNNICRWCVMNDVDSITMWCDLYNEKVHMIAAQYGIDVYVHTENDPESAANYLINGVKGIYTDTITEGELEAYNDLLKVVYFNAEDYNAFDYVYSGVAEPEQNATYSLINRSQATFYIPLYENAEKISVEIYVAEVVDEIQRYEIWQGSQQITAGEITCQDEKIQFEIAPIEGELYFTIKVPDAILVQESPDGSTAENEMESIGLSMIVINKRDDF